LRDGAGLVPRLESAGTKNPACGSEMKTLCLISTTTKRRWDPYVGTWLTVEQVARGGTKCRAAEHGPAQCGQPQFRSMSEVRRAWNWNEMERNGSFEGL
jgi:hypothetical protein